MKIRYNCMYCDQIAYDKPSSYKKKSKHFCSQRCYSLYRAERLPKEEQNAYKGGGLPEIEKQKRRKARSDANHAIRDGKLFQKPCEVCNRKDAQMHHHDYNKPLEIKWLCRKCHWDEHKMIYQNPELLPTKEPISTN